MYFNFWVFKIASLQERGVVFYSRFLLGEHTVDRGVAGCFNYVWCSPNLMRKLGDLQSARRADIKGYLGSVREAMNLKVKACSIEGSIAWSSELKLVFFQFLLSFYWLFK